MLDERGSFQVRRTAVSFRSSPICTGSPMNRKP
jgi:hypothetical protein